MDAIAAHLEAIEWSHQLLEMVIDDVTPELANAIPSGTANPIGATYAHALYAEDALISMLKGSQPLFATSWAGKTGSSDPQMSQTSEWSRGLRPDLPTLRRYAQAVYQQTLDYVGSLNEAALDNQVDLNGVGLGVRSVNWFLSALIEGHNHNMAGELSALKGTQGAKGYPF